MWHRETHIDSTASAARLWRLLADVSGWHRWNAGVQSATLHGPFESGQTFSMQLPGDDPPLTSTLLDVRPQAGFTDETWVGETCVRVAHLLHPLPGGGTRVSYRTEVTGPDAADIGAAVSSDFDQVLAALRRHAEAEVPRQPDTP